MKMKFAEERQVVRAAINLMLKNPKFRDAVDGISTLNRWDGCALIERAAFNAEVLRAMRAANHSAALVGAVRDHSNWGEEERPICAPHTLSDGTVLRQLMYAAGIVGDWFFVPAMSIATTQDFTETE